MAKINPMALGQLFNNMTAMSAQPGSAASNNTQTMQSQFAAMQAAEAERKEKEKAEKAKKGKMLGDAGALVGSIAGAALAPLTMGASIPLAATLGSSMGPIMGAAGGVLGGTAGTLAGGGDIDPAHLVRYGVSGMTMGGGLGMQNTEMLGVTNLMRGGGGGGDAGSIIRELPLAGASNMISEAPGNVANYAKFATAPAIPKAGNAGMAGMGGATAGGALAQQPGYWQRFGQMAKSTLAQPALSMFQQTGPNDFYYNPQAQQPGYYY